MQSTSQRRIFRQFDRHKLDAEIAQLMHECGARRDLCRTDSLIVASIYIQTGFSRGYVA